MTNNIHVEIRLYGSFRIGRFKSESREIPSGATVDHVIQQLDLPHGQVGIVIINDRHASKEHILQDGDTVSLFPFVAGG